MNNKKYTQELASKCETHLKKDGYYLVEDMYDNDFCNEVKQFIDDQKIIENVELNYGGTEKRIWHAHHKNYLVEEFFNDSNEFSSLMNSGHLKASTVLAYRNIPLGDKYKSFKDLSFNWALARIIA